jgi:hypothetical protein
MASGNQCHPGVPSWWAPGLARFGKKKKEFKKKMVKTTKSKK